MKELKYLDITKTNQGHIKVPSVEGMYPDMGAGRAEAIVTNIHDTDLVPYVFRKTPFRSTRETEKMIGVSVPWNQLVDPKAGSIRGVTITVSNGKITWSGTASSSGGRTTNAYNKLVPVVSGHKYICMTTLPVVPATYLTKDGETSTYITVLATGASVGIAGATFTGDAFLGHSFVNGTDYSGSGYVILTDLTLALGSTIADYIYTLESGTAGAGVAKLREWGFFDKPYYAYNAGAIESVNVSKHRMVGLNIFDEAWVSGSFDANGELITNANWSASEHFMDVVGGKQYYLNVDGISSSNNVYLFYYDADKNFIGNSGSQTSKTAPTIPSNCRYAKIQYKQKIANVVNYPVCINISNPSVNGQYAPYTVHEYPLADITLRGILKLDGSNNLYADGDVYESDGTVTRKYGIVDLGSLNWTRDIAGTNPIFYASVTGAKVYDNNVTPYSVTPNYPVGWNAASRSGLATNLPNKSLSWIYGGTNVVIRDDDITTEGAFTTAMSGKYLVYELATPTTETTDPFTNPQVCSPYGTEEYVDRAVAAGTRDVAIPCGHETEYAKDIVGAIEGIPFPPSSNGTYTLKVTVASGVPTYSWVSE